MKRLVGMMIVLPSLTITACQYKTDNKNSLDSTFGPSSPSEFDYKKSQQYMADNFKPRIPKVCTTVSVKKQDGQYSLSTSSSSPSIPSSSSKNSFMNSTCDETALMEAALLLCQKPFAETLEANPKLEQLKASLAALQEYPWAREAIEQQIKSYEDEKIARQAHFKKEQEETKTRGIQAAKNFRAKYDRAVEEREELEKQKQKIEQALATTAAKIVRYKDHLFKAGQVLTDSMISSEAGKI